MSSNHEEKSFSHGVIRGNEDFKFWSGHPDRQAGKPPRAIVDVCMMKPVCAYHDDEICISNFDLSGGLRFNFVGVDVLDDPRK